MKFAYRFGQLIYALTGLAFVLVGGLGILSGTWREGLFLVFGLFNLLLVRFSFIKQRSSVSLVTLAALNIGFSSASAYYILGKQYDLAIDRISSVSIDVLVLLISLVLFFLFWRKSLAGEIRRTNSSSQENNIAP